MENNVKYSSIDDMIHVFLLLMYRCLINSTLAIMLNGYVKHEKDMK